ncbi:hypothetical protein HanIR_Chr01g0049081 [Helianthus annuus]|nr:hypothetical protein HanIR_Chr01g0049081 [Helianthus annuus]
MYKNLRGSRGKIGICGDETCRLPFIRCFTFLVPLKILMNPQNTPRTALQNKPSDDGCGNYDQLCSLRSSFLEQVRVWVSNCKCKLLFP